ncbi:MAG: hypothetical protein JWM65_890 [Sphingomonas bacterium]|nr:hypothetical protein [Sphingomonas bacterium]
MRRLLALCLLWLACAPGAAAGQLAGEEVRDAPRVTLDPARAYVMFTGNKLGQTLTLISIPTKQEQDDYRQRRSAALAEAKRHYPEALAAWNQQAAGGKPSDPKPVEPSEENFRFPLPINVVSMGVFNHFFAKSDRGTVYLSSIPAGDYYVADAPFGLVYNVPPTCFCLGTVRFHVAAGRVTNMGRLVSNYYEALMRARATGTPKPRTHFDFPEGVTSMTIEPAAAGDPVDPRLGGFPVTPAAYRPFGKFPNTSNYIVDRLTAMPGVFRYERDRMIDLTTNPAP